MSQVTAEQLKAVTMKYAENFDMSNWAVSEEYYNDLKDNMTIVKKLGECGTSCCLAGNACLIAGDKLVIVAGNLRAVAKDGTQDYIPDRASKLLGLEHEFAVPHDLFNHGFWPEDLLEEYSDATSNLERARVACKAVDYYMGGD